MSTPSDPRDPSGRRDPFAPPAAGAGPPAPVPPPAGYGGYRSVPRNGYGTTAVVLGIVGLLGSWLIVGALLAIPAIVFGVLGRGRARRGEATNPGAATAGVVLGIVGLLVSVGLVTAGITFYQRHRPAFEQYQDCLKRAGSDRSARDACRQRLDDAIAHRR